MTETGPLLVDEQSKPPLRARVGSLLASADDAAFAVARIRLGVLDLTDQELGRLRRCRVLLAHLDASMLLDTAEVPAGVPADPRSAAVGGRGSALRRLHAFVTSGRLEVRSAGLGGWKPDFAVLDGESGRTGLVGSIQFGNPELILGPAFTVIVTDPTSISRLAGRFDEIWQLSHDVLPAIREVLERGYDVERAAPAGRGHQDARNPLQG
jgi:hypothetical protein